jgi:hypothetical protein
MSMPPAAEAITTGLPVRTVEGHRDVELARDLGRLLDENLLHLLPFGAGLMGDELHAEDLPGVRRGLFGEGASLTPPPLPRPPAWIWALTTQRPPSSAQIARASSGSAVTLPRGVGTP